MAICALIPLMFALNILNHNAKYFFADRLEKEAIEISMLAVDNTRVKTAYSTIPPDIDVLQRFANDIKDKTTANIIFLDNDKVLTHPNPLSEGSLLSLEDESKIVPIFVNGYQVGGVVTVFQEPDINHLSSQMYRSVYIVALLTIMIVSLILTNIIIKRLIGVLVLREGILHSVNEGIIATDENLVITMVNRAAKELLPRDTELEGKKVSHLIPDSPLVNVVITQKPEYNKQLSINGNNVLSNSFPLFFNKRISGAVMTIRPMTEVTLLAEELTGVKRIVEALRARTHEFSDKLHVISGLLQLDSYEEATKYVASVAQEEKALLSCILSNFRIKAITGLLIGKASEAEEKRIKFRINPESYLFSLPDSFDEHASVIVLGNLIENAFDAAKDFAKDPEVVISIEQLEASIIFEVKDNGPGINLPLDVQHVIFEPGFTTKSNGTGYGLANVKSRVVLARGEISYSCNEEGTTFRVTIPYDVLLDEEWGGIQVGTD